MTVATIKTVFNFVSDFFDDGRQSTRLKANSILGMI